MPKVPDDTQISLAADVLACGGTSIDIAHELERTSGIDGGEADELAIDALRALARSGSADAHMELLAAAQAERTRRPWGCGSGGNADGWYAAGRSGPQGPYASLREAMIRNSSAW